MKKRHVIVYSFQSLEDPLLKGLMLEYLKRTDPSLQLHFHLITHEQAPFALEKNAAQRKTYELEKNHCVSWHPVTYHSGKFLLLKKAYDFILTLFMCLRIYRQCKPKAIVGFLPIAGGYSAILSVLLRIKLVVYCLEPHSEYLADFGTWKKNSVKYRLLRFFEKYQVTRSSHIVVPTSYTKELAEKIQPKNKIYVCPISVDTGFLKFEPLQRENIRGQIGCNGKTVMIYTGKFGGLYYSAEMIIAFFKKLQQLHPVYFLYVITPDHEEVKHEISGQGLPEDSCYVIPPVPYEQLASHLSAADIGLVAVPPFPSMKYRTPVKTGIYLSCGLPYLINANVAEDDIIAQRENTGVVTPDFSVAELSLIDGKISLLMAENRENLRSRCRQTAEKYRSTTLAAGILNEIFSDIYRQ